MSHLCLKDMIRLLSLSSLSLSQLHHQEPMWDGRGGGSVISRVAFIVFHKAAFYYHWHCDEGQTDNPFCHYQKASPPLCCETRTAAVSLLFIKRYHSCTVTMGATVMTHWGHFNWPEMCLSATDELLSVAPGAL